jgi:glycosyltransferase involved in cell wall biosynthesis
MESIVSNQIITVVTVSYNASRVIEETILSVINQTYPYLEYIIIDGGSTDGTIDIIKKYEHKIAYWTSEPDKGIYDAMNKGLDRATGEWINFMNAGDCFYEKFTVEKVVNHLSSLSFAVIYGDYIAKTSIGLFYQKPTTPFFLSNKYIVSKDICHQSVFVKTLLAQTIRFDLNYHISADFKMLYEIYKLNYPFFYISEAVAVFEVEAGFSMNNRILAYKESARVQGKDKTLHFYFKIIRIICWEFIRKLFSGTVKKFFPSFFLARKKKKLNACFKE